MVKEKTIEFVRKNRELLCEVAEKGDTAVKPLAAAMLILVPPENKEADDADTERQTGLDRFLEEGGAVGEE
ncbi:hypothetical protein AKJ38_03425 [candidate division MSBL1 archaeon SCGC-AAA259I14]|uniref:Uncharacterized protein n=1 Tax=candidate division MSBL1 archaeon SCGC-AAA259I14 TaxID=1698268 RepID=A0A133UQD8_9EURY|nr:hypothetical protein AKJ38_03425 [candidate division MSBL1 archaeon SCGC-AAA259I14]